MYNLNEFIDEFSEDIAGQRTGHGIIAEHHCGDIRCYVPKAGLTMALTEMVKNSFEAYANRVRIITDISVKEFMMGVEDDGEGISDEVYNTILGYGVSTKGGKRGRGLFFVNLLAKKYHGSLEYANKEQGAVFIIHFPNDESIDESVAEYMDSLP